MHRSTEHNSSIFRRGDTIWDSVTQETVINCWIHSGLIQRSDTSPKSDNTDDSDELQNLLQRVQEDLDMDLDMRLTIRQIIDADCDASPSEVLTHQEIFDTVKITDLNSESDSDYEPPKFHIPTISETQSSIRF